MDRNDDPDFAKDSRISFPELKILASTRSGPKLIEEISSDTNIPPAECRDRIVGLIDLGLLTVEHDSDLYGHELLKVRFVSRQI
jgi:hypothetical protein